MTDYDNTNRGALFKNEDKQSENHPDYKGNVNFNGVDCFIDAWLKTAKTGKKYMSLSVKPKNQQRAAPKQEPPKSGDDFDDDLPF